MLKSDYAGVRKLMKQVHQLHYVNRPDIFLDGDALSQSYFEKTRHLHMKAMNHDIHSLFCTLHLDISLFLENLLLIV